MFDITKCDGYCTHCNEEILNIPIDSLTICPNCGNTVFPCNACSISLDDECDFSKTWHCKLLNIQMTTECCPNCDNEVLINGDKPSVCPECGETILPCSMCPIDFGSVGQCDWTEEKGCWRFAKPYQI